MSGEVVTREARVVSGGQAGVTVEVALRVGDQTLGHRGLAAAIELVLDDGTPVTVLTDARTRTGDLSERSETGPWRKLSGLAHAELLRDHAPGPHVRASLVERYVAPGARVIVRGPVVEGSAAAPNKIRAVELRRSTAHEQAVAAERTRTRADLRDLIGRGLGALLLVASVAWALRWIGQWPAQLVHPGVDKLRVAVGVAASASAAVWLSLLLRRRGGRIRMLPRFVGGDGDPVGLASDLMLFMGLVMTGFFGLFGSGFALHNIAAANDVAFAGPKGRPAESGGFFLGVTAVCAGVTWLSLLAWEHREARLAKLLRPLGADWQLARGRLVSGGLRLWSEVFGRGKGATTVWRAALDEPLVVEGAAQRWTVAGEGLVWAVDLGLSPERADNGTTKIWRTGPGAAVILAGRLDGHELRASGPESLVLVASELDDDPLTSIRRGLWKRRLVLALPVLGALASAAAVYL